MDAASFDVDLAALDLAEAHRKFDEFGAPFLELLIHWRHSFDLEDTIYALCEANVRAAIFPLIAAAAIEQYMRYEPIVQAAWDADPSAWRAVVRSSPRADYILMFPYIDHPELDDLQNLVCLLPGWDGHYATEALKKIDAPERTEAMLNVLESGASSKAKLGAIAVLEDVELAASDQDRVRAIHDKTKQVKYRTRLSTLFRSEPIIATEAGFLDRLQALPSFNLQFWQDLKGVKLKTVSGKNLKKADVEKVVGLLRSEDWAEAEAFFRWIDPSLRSALGEKTYEDVAKIRRSKDTWAVRQLVVTASDELLDSIDQRLDDEKKRWGNAGRVSRAIRELMAVMLDRDRADVVVHALNHPLSKTRAEAVAILLARRMEYESISKDLPPPDSDRESRVWFDFESGVEVEIDSNRFALGYEFGTGELILVDGDGSETRCHKNQIPKSQRAIFDSMKTSREDAVVFLETYLAEGRRWSGQMFARLLGLPLFRALASGVVFTIDETCCLQGDDHFFDVDDHRVELRPEASVRIAHPTDENFDVTRWSEILASFERFPAITQLDRRCPDEIVDSPAETTPWVKHRGQLIRYFHGDDCLVSFAKHGEGPSAWVGGISTEWTEIPDRIRFEVTRDTGRV